MNVPLMRMFGPDPESVTCPSCGHVVVTVIKHRPNTMTHLLALLLCCLWCCWIPYCVDTCQDTTHSCPHCQAVKFS